MSCNKKSYHNCEYTNRINTSFNSTLYDKCEYKNRLNTSTDSLNYLLNVSKYENNKRCHNNLGLAGGVEVQEIKRNLVDLESELRGQFKIQSLCPEKKHSFYNNGMNESEINIEQNLCKKSRTIKTKYPKMKSCQFIDFSNIGMEGCSNL